MHKKLVFNTAAFAIGITFAFAVAVDYGRADHGPGVPIARYMPQSQDEAQIIKLIRTVARGWAMKDVDLIMSAYGQDALQRSWDNSNIMIDHAGIRAEAIGAFRDPRVGVIRFEDWIHHIYIVNNSAVVEINEKFHGWGRDHYYRDFWMFARRGGKWRLVRYDYEPQPPF